MNFMLGRDFLLVVGLSTYLETEKYNYGKILCMKLGNEQKAVTSFIPKLYMCSCISIFIKCVCHFNFFIPTT